MFTKKTYMNFSTEIQTDVNTLFDFHTDTNNLLHITPPWIKVAIVSLDLPLVQGSEIELKITRFGFSQLWKMEIATLTKPSLVCDKALKSPFKSFVHKHNFKVINEEKSLLWDELEVSLPFYPLSCILLPFIKRDISKMFAYRHKQTKLLLEKV